MPLDQLMSIGQAVPITRWGDPVMHTPTRAVEEFGPDLWDLVATMFATNRAAEGAGLAAPQVGADLAVFIYDTIDDIGRHHTGLLCNPTIEIPEQGRQLVTEHEGCLSLPGAYTQLPRPYFAICHGQDQFGKQITIQGTGYFARCLQHETDHLNGIVMEDRLSAKARRAHRSQHASAADRYSPHWPTPLTSAP